MGIFLTLTFSLAFIAFLVGLIKPSVFSFLKTDPSRKDILLRIGLPTLGLFILAVIVSPPVDYYKKGREYYDKANYEDAAGYFGKVSEKDQNYKLAQMFRRKSLIKIDSLEKNAKRVEVKKNIEPAVVKSNKVNITSEEFKQTSNIAGITPVDVYGNFENKGFKVDKQISSDGSLFICTSEENGISYEVKTYSERSVTEVTSIRLTATRIDPQYNKLSDLKPFLKYGSSVPYEGSDINKIQSFIELNFNKNKESLIISGVKFTIFAPTEFMRMIEIEKE